MLHPAILAILVQKPVFEVVNLTTLLDVFQRSQSFGAVLRVHPHRPLVDTAGHFFRAVASNFSQADAPENVARVAVILIQRSEERRVGKECSSRWSSYC